MRRPGSGGSALVSIAISPVLPSVAPGSVIQMTALGTYSDGTILDITSQVQWLSTDPSVGSIASGAGKGKFTAITSGTTDVQAIDGPVQSNIIVATVPLGTATHVAIPFPADSGTTPEAGGRTYSMALFIPPDVSTFNLRLANRVESAIVQPDITINVAAYQSDGTGQPTGAPFAVFNGQLIPGDNSVVSVGPFPDIVRGTDGQIVVLIGMAQGEDPVFDSGISVGLYLTGSDDVSAPPVWAGTNPNAVMYVELDYETAARRLIIVGDALSTGFPAVGYSKSQFQIIAADLVYAFSNASITNTHSSLQNWAGYLARPTWYDEPIWSTSDVVINLGTNDLAYNDLATMQASLQALITHLQTLSVRNIYASTVPPTTAFPTADGTRAAYNAWLLANYSSLGLTAVRDRAAAQNVGGLADNADPNALYAPFDEGDGTQLNEVGYQQEADGWKITLTTLTHVLMRVASPIPNQTAVNGATPTIYKRAMYLPSDVSQVTVRIGNRGGAGGIGTPTPGVNIALYTSDGAAAPNEDGTGASLATWLNQTIPGDGSDWVAPMATDIVRGTDGKVVLVISLPPNANIATVDQNIYGTYVANTDVVDPLPAGGTPDPSPVYLFHLDYRTNRRRVITIGDSIAVACVAATGFEISAWYQLGPNKDYASELLAKPGATLAMWADFTTFAYLWADGVFDNAIVWIQAGVNDLPSGAAAMEADITTIVNHLNTLGVAHIFANTIAPQNLYAGTEAIRTAYNTWLKANSLGIDAVADFAAIQTNGGLASNADPTVLVPAFSADGTHWSDAGHDQAYAMVAATLP